MAVKFQVNSIQTGLEDRTIGRAWRCNLSTVRTAMTSKARYESHGEHKKQPSFCARAQIPFYTSSRGLGIQWIKQRQTDSSRHVGCRLMIGSPLQSLVRIPGREVVETASSNQIGCPSVTITAGGLSSTPFLGAFSYFTYNQSINSLVMIAPRNR